jgi:serine/threonine protein kinase
VDDSGLYYRVLQVDVWALGCVVYHMLSGQPPEEAIAPQVNPKWRVNPSPQHSVDSASGLPDNMAYFFFFMQMLKQEEHSTLEVLVPPFIRVLEHRDLPEAVQLLAGAFALDPRTRKSAAELLTEPFCIHEPAGWHA